MIDRVPRDADAHVDLHHALRALAARGITRVFSEGGPKVASRLIGLKLADEVALITADKPLGRAGVLALDPDARAALLDGSKYCPVETLDYGPDTMRLWQRAEGSARAIPS
jgi:diaminohydroxyphosphoribosylaminopyrimidine deaminase/5-amino-6-(5-phosphoribosylamino)uracil reductase